MTRVRSTVLAVALAALTTCALDAVGQPAFALTRVELVFQSGRGDITVPLRYPDLRVYATLHFAGSGVLRAQWRVDGRILGAVVEPVVFGEMLIFATPKGASPFLPTFEPGLHRVTLEVTEPRPAFKLPEITYFVTAEEWDDFKMRMEKRR